jgi:conflict system STAND superfamily ATPase
MTWAGRGADPKRFAKMSLGDFLQERKCPVDEAGSRVLRIAIFDRFEELFTFYPERWRERRAFFTQVCEAIQAADPGLRTIFVMREDHLAEIDPYATIAPEKFRTRFRLERMREQRALDCVQKPLETTTRRFAPGVAQALIDQLLGLKRPDLTAKPSRQKSSSSSWFNCRSSAKTFGINSGRTMTRSVWMTWHQPTQVKPC